MCGVNKGKGRKLTVGWVSDLETKWGKQGSRKDRPVSLRSWAAGVTPVPNKLLPHRLMGT